MLARYAPSSVASKAGATSPIVAAFRERQKLSTGLDTCRQPRRNIPYPFLGRNLGSLNLPVYQSLPRISARIGLLAEQMLILSQGGAKVRGSSSVELGLGTLSEWRE